MSLLGWIFLTVIVLLLVGGAPRWPYSQNWGYAAPSIGIVLLIVFAILVYLGRIHLNIN